MHLQQTKKGSLGTGGPQYYFHNLDDHIRLYLRSKGAVGVALVTPYGATKSDYFAVSLDRKFDRGGNLVPGNVGHDRIQQGRAGESIGESIRMWYKLPAGDFDRIGIDIDVKDEVFYLKPHSYKFIGSKKECDIATLDKPLTFTKDYVSPFWLRQMSHVDKKQPGIVSWSLEEICRIVQAHKAKTKLAHIQETDILRASGPLRHLGVAIGGYVGKGYDCITEFTFLHYPAYTVPVEIKKNSRDFEYQQKKYGKDLLSRAVILCAVHDHKRVPKNIDVIELDAMCDHWKSFPS
ncbi:MAG TPA: hypothetical protein VFA21_17335 [Pyrinomonadaceae bacterium]|nr:hypothetical protein [Pyrinomonadaceae bacterium]